MCVLLENATALAVALSLEDFMQREEREVVPSKDFTV